MQIEGTISKIRFYAPDSGFAILLLRSEDGAYKYTGSKATAAKGTMAHPVEGESVRLEGEWKDDPKWGPQFDFSSYERLGLSRGGFERWLADTIPGVGPAKAEQIAEEFNSIEELHGAVDDPYLSESLAAVIGNSAFKWLEEIRVKLLDCGLTSWQAGQALQKWGKSAGSIVEDDPYKLMEIPGIGWKKADAVARKVGIPADSPNRIRAGILYRLGILTDDQGNTVVEKCSIVDSAASELGIGKGPVRDRLAEMLETEQDIVEWESVDGVLHVCPTSLYYAEEVIRDKIVEMICLGDPGDVPEICDEEIDDLNESQKKGLEDATRNRVVVVTGGPGVGKTFLCRAILDVLEAYQVKISCCAPTGKAAKRLSELIGRPAQTIHRLLEFSPSYGGFQRNSGCPLSADVVLVDEVSMTDVRLMASLVSAVRSTSRLILVGDVDQLPSVGPGAVLRDLIESGCVPVAHLTEIMRQAEGSSIIAAAHAINAGQLPKGDDDASGEMFWFKMSEPEAILEEVKSLVGHGRLKKAFPSIDPLRDIQVLAPMRKGPLGVEKLNEVLAPLLNPSRDPSKRLDVGDRIMNIQNDYDPVMMRSMRAEEDGTYTNLKTNGDGEPLFNGYVGFVTARIKVRTGVVDKRGRIRTREMLVADFDDEDYVFTEGDHSKVLSYASTIHKSQGSEYPIVVIPTYKGHYIMLRRNLLYTAVTRAERACVLLGSSKAVGMAVRNVDDKIRATRLKEILRLSFDDR